MGGFHFLDLIVILIIGLLIFGPKTMQSMARNAGKGLNQVKELKDKALAELPMEELSEVSKVIPRIPLNSQQVFEMLITSEITSKPQENKKGISEQPQTLESEETPVSHKHESVQE